MMIPEDITNNNESGREGEENGKKKSPIVMSQGVKVMKIEKKNNVLSNKDYFSNKRARL